MIAHLMRAPAVALSLAYLSACSPPSPDSVRIGPPIPPVSEKVQTLSPEQAAALLKELPQMLVLDVRTDREWREDGHLPAARLLDFMHGDETLAELAKLDRRSPCLIYCAIGGRAKLIAAEMEALGFDRLYLLESGSNAWIAAGLPVQH